VIDNTQFHNPFLDKLAARFAAAGHRLVLVGGVVRDVAAGRAAGEIDGATDAPVETIRRLVQAARPSSLYAVGEKFGTIGLTADGRPYEITAFRTGADGTAPLPPPGSDMAADLYGDLALRDFTLNAMAYDPRAERLYDPFGGLADLAAGVLRGVGDPAARFAEDPLRLLRAVRLALRYGFRLDPATRAAMTAGAPDLARVAWERQAAEMNRILGEPKPSAGLRLLDDTGLLGQVLPEMMPMHGMQQGPRYKDVYEHTLQVVDRAAAADPPPADLTLRWAALLHDIAKPRTFSVQDGEVHFHGHEVVGARMARDILTRLRQPGDLVDHVEQLVAQHLRVGLYDAGWTDGAVRRFVRESIPVTERLIALARADVTSANPRRVAAAANRVTALLARCATLEAQAEIAKIKSPLDGVELMALFSRPPGPWIRPLKDYLLGLVLDGQLAQDDPATATDLARAWMAAQGGSTGD